MFRDAKRGLRKNFREKLNSLTFDQQIQKTSDLSDKFDEFFFHPFQDRLQKYVVGYYALENEPQINFEVLKTKLAYVRVNDWAKGTMEAVEARRDLPGQWEEFEPRPGVFLNQPAHTQPIVPKESVEVIFVPALAFDREGHRLGRGKGFYDRYLSQLPQALRIGVAFSEQIVDSLHRDEWDERVDAILTDREWIETPRFSSWKNHGTLKR